MCLQRGTGKPQALAAEPLAFLWGGPRRQMKAVCQGRRPFFSHLPVPRGGCFCAHRQASKHAEHTCCACAQSRRPPVAGVPVLAEGPSATTQAHARAQTQRQTDGRAGGRTDKPTGKQASRRAGQIWGDKKCAFSCRPCRPRCRPLRKFLSSPAVPF